MSAPLPHNEDLRLDALKQYEILDTADETAFDDLVLLAATVCGTPMAAVTLVDEYRQWFKARIGLGFRDTDRDVSFCAHAILRPDQVLVVPDAFLDDRFSEGQLVLAKPHIRFYAGAPLVNPEGMPLGCLCVMDRDSRGMSANQLESLKALGRQVVAQLELRRSKIMLRNQADKLVSTSDEARSADKAKSFFLTNVSHEFRTPVNGIMGITSLLMETPLSERQRHYVESVEKSADALLNVMSNIVEHAKCENGNSEVGLSEINVASVVEKAVAMMSPVAMSKQLRFVTTVDSDLRRKLMGDELKIQQILANLIGNAIKFTGEGSVEVNVKNLAENPQGVVVRFEVRDTGIGIPKDKQAVIFDAFAQGDQGSDRMFGGVGLGLSVCRQLAQQMGTQIDLKSDLGLGSTFGMNLMMPFELPGVESANVSPRTSVVASRGVPRILVAEDNEVNCLVITSMLEHHGCEVVCVDNGEEALHTLKSDRFDLVFMDIQMPKLDGMQTARAIRNLPFPACNIPVVALSASILKDDESYCRAAGMNDIMSKPISERTVKQTLGRWLVRSDSTALI